MLQKNDIVKVVISDSGFDGEGIAKVNGYTVFVKNAVLGDELNVRILKPNKSYAYAKIEEIIKPSDKRRKAVCNVFGKCGGCDLMHIKYENQLEIKENIVKTNILKYSSYTEDDFEFNKIVPSDDEYFYRNKVQIPLEMCKGQINIGFFAQSSHRVVPFDVCHIQHERINEISKVCLEFIKSENIPIYDEKTHSGIVRNIFIRDFDEKSMVCFVTNSSKKLKNTDKLAKSLERFNVTGIIQNVNTKKSNTLLGDKNIVLRGDEYIFASLSGMKFKISVHSFFQINTRQAEKLYKIAVDFANINKDETVLDLYCGVGTITLSMAKKAKRAIGVEITEQAVLNARENAKINGFENAEFYLGDCFKVVDSLIKSGVKADVVIVDPPRKGCSEKLLDLIEKISPKKVVYVSCNSATLARDLKILREKGFVLKKLTPVDMFPQTRHVECVVLLQCRDM